MVSKLINADSDSFWKWWAGKPEASEFRPMVLWVERTAQKRSPGSNIR